RMIPALRRAMAELERRGLAHLVDPGDYAGCYAPRRIPTSRTLSLHAWGLAVDLNASRNPQGSPPHQDLRLVHVMERHGFSWGGRWPTVPDGMHFEFHVGGPWTVACGVPPAPARGARPRSPCSATRPAAPGSRRT